MTGAGSWLGALCAPVDVCLAISTDDDELQVLPWLLAYQCQPDVSAFV